MCFKTKFSAFRTSHHPSLQFSGDGEEPFHRTVTEVRIGDEHHGTGAGDDGEAERAAAFHDEGNGGIGGVDGPAGVVDPEDGDVEAVAFAGDLDDVLGTDGDEDGVHCCRDGREIGIADVAVDHTAGTSDGVDGPTAAFELGVDRIGDGLFAGGSTDNGDGGGGEEPLDEYVCGFHGNPFIRKCGTDVR